MADTRPIYLDYHATTPCDRRVVEAMAPYFVEEFGNAASRIHRYGWRAEEGVERARAQVARLLGADPREIVFTSGATEACNLALFGVARAQAHTGDHIIVCTTEHKAVLDPCRALEREGFRITRLAVARDGGLDLDRLRDALTPATRLVSVMHANNEIGVIHPLDRISSITRERGVLLHTDAAQSAGKVGVRVDELGVDLLSISAHKMYGPKGIGALYVRRRQPPIRLEPLLHGGGHERGLRSGTLPVPLCVGFGLACEIAEEGREIEARRVRALRDRLWDHLARGVDSIVLNGAFESRLPGNLNVCIPGVEASALLLALPDVALSTGSACTSGSPAPSHVLMGLGMGRDRALSSIRIGIGRLTTAEEVDRAAFRIAEEVGRLRSLAGSGVGPGAARGERRSGRRHPPEPAGIPYPGESRAGRRDHPGPGGVTHGPGRQRHTGVRMSERPKSENIVWSEGHISREHRRALLGHGAGTVWFTGLSGSGKSTIAVAVERELNERGTLAYVLDGDNIRHGLNSNLGFGPADRKENIRRIGEVAKLFNDAGVVVLTAFISPYREDRDEVRKKLPDDEFVEVFVECSLEECERRDVKGLYKRARAGEIPEFTGISAPYEPPEKPELVLRSDRLSPEECVATVMRELERRGWVAR